MLDFFYKIPDTSLFLLLSGFFILSSLLSVFLIHRYVPIRVRYKDNAVVGSIASVIGIIYGVLVGLMALYLINNISYTSDAVQREASAVANLYRDSQWLENPAQTNIKNLIKTYLVKVINVEWPLMEAGKKIDGEGELIIKQIGDQINHYSKLHVADELVSRDMFEELKTFYNAREQRISMSFSQLDGEIWLVIFIGTILTLGINFLFKMSYFLHIVSMTATALMAASIIFLLLTLDRPFQGEFVVQPDRLKAILETMVK